jgi:hypothetical protein
LHIQQGSLSIILLFAVFAFHRLDLQLTKILMLCISSCMVCMGAKLSMIIVNNSACAAVRIKEQIGIAAGLCLLEGWISKQGCHRASMSQLCAVET